MDTKHNINYFNKKDIVKTIGAVCLAIGALGVFFAFSSYVGYIVAMLLIPGLVIFIVGTTIVSSENDIDEDIRKALIGVEKELANDKAYAKRILKNISPITAEGYDYEEGLMLRKAKNSSIRSSQYTKAILYPLSDALLVSSRTVSLVSTEKKDEFFEVSYKDIQSISLEVCEEKLSYLKDSFNIKSSRIVVRHSDGLTFSAPLADTMSNEDIVNKLGELISLSKTAE